ncbi:lysozyme g [Austrofundulus limnaeus]|uniref:Lysozyme g n=1 Tax=Austrofundulus limnaeus TaxID=52670 RepID=A0A2I4AYA2_AUSLI|nr:PREDICTED: lysozyme g-like [Austrofundulus limnaeus]
MSLGNIDKVETSGASQQTAKQDKLGVVGVAASEAMAKTDAGRMGKYKTIINNVGRKHGVDPALIAGIISRESRAGNTLQNGWGDWSPQRNAFNAWGLMQVDVNPNGGGHTKRGEWNSEEHLSQATEILLYFQGRIQKKFPGWTPEQQLKGTIAAYNTGDGRVDSYDNVDAKTTGKDYSNDVVARAKWYKKNGF